MACKHAFLDLDRTLGLDAEWFRAFRGYALSRANVPHVKRTMRQLIRSGTWPLHVIDDAGHVPHIERPNAFLAALHGALASSQP